MGGFNRIHDSASLCRLHREQFLRRAVSEAIRTNQKKEKNIKWSHASQLYTWKMPSKQIRHGMKNNYIFAYYAYTIPCPKQQKHPLSAASIFSFKTSDSGEHSAAWPKHETDLHHLPFSAIDWPNSTSSLHVPRLGWWFLPTHL